MKSRLFKKRTESNYYISDNCLMIYRHNHKGWYWGMKFADGCLVWEADTLNKNFLTNYVVVSEDYIRLNYPHLLTNKEINKQEVLEELRRRNEEEDDEDDEDYDYEGEAEEIW